MLHDDEVTYSFVCPTNFLDGGESIVKSYKEISSALIEGLKLLGIEAELGNKKTKKGEVRADLAFIFAVNCKLFFFLFLFLLFVHFLYNGLIDVGVLHTLLCFACP